jgi:hypothetical protein
VRSKELNLLDEKTSAPDAQAITALWLSRYPANSYLGRGFLYTTAVCASKEIATKVLTSLKDDFTFMGVRYCSMRLHY